MHREFAPPTKTRTRANDFNPLHFTACFFRPDRISDIRAWQQHIPFAFAIMQMLRPHSFVELGTHKGDSYLAFCQAVAELYLPTQCVAVDTWQGDGQAGIYDDSIYDELAAYHNPRYAGFSRLQRSTFDDALGQVADRSVDLLHIDGLHTYDAVRHDFETWRGKLSDRAVVLFHDVAVRKAGYEVHQYWNELRCEYPSFTFEHGNGLGVLGVGNDLPAAAAGLFQLDSQAAAAARYFFEMLGKRVTAMPATVRDAADGSPAVQPSRSVPAITREDASARLANWTDAPTLSILIDELEGTAVDAALSCLLGQFYPHWELVVLRAATASDSGPAHDPRVRFVPSTGQTTASRRNMAVDAAHGEFVAWLPAGAVLTDDALFELALALVEPPADVAYADEETVPGDGQGGTALYKPDFSPDYLLSANYIGEFAVIRRSLLQGIGGYRDAADGALAYDVLLRFAAAPVRFAHVSRLLYRQKARTGLVKDDAVVGADTWEAGRFALNDLLACNGVDARVERGLLAGTYRVRRTIRGAPLVSILLPFRDKPELLQQCVRSILARTHYPHFEIVGIDNGSHLDATAALCAALAADDSRVRFIRDERPFNYSAVNNLGAQHARGTHLLFLNNDTEVLEAEWLAAMLEQSQRPEVGVVGAQLRFADDSLQHCGVTLDPEVVALHHHKFLAPGALGYAGRPHLIQNASAVTFACAMSRREVFDRLGGLDEELRVCFNDVDYCLRAQEAGYLVVYTPYARLRHFESKSRGRDGDAAQRERLQHETMYMRTRHAEAFARGDRYFNLRV